MQTWQQQQQQQQQYGNNGSMQQLQPAYNPAQPQPFYNTTQTQVRICWEGLQVWSAAELVGHCNSTFLCAKCSVVARFAGLDVT